MNKNMKTVSFFARKNLFQNLHSNGTLYSKISWELVPLGSPTQHGSTRAATDMLCYMYSLQK